MSPGPWLLLTPSPPTPCTENLKHLCSSLAWASPAGTQRLLPRRRRSRRSRVSSPARDKPSSPGQQGALSPRRGSQPDPAPAGPFVLSWNSGPCALTCRQAPSLSPAQPSQTKPLPVRRLRRPRSVSTLPAGLSSRFRLLWLLYPLLLNWLSSVSSKTSRVPRPPPGSTGSPCAQPHSAPGLPAASPAPLFSLLFGLVLLQQVL